jgi:NitT/TauT family transport system substrate-binding protein
MIRKMCLVLLCLLMLGSCKRATDARAPVRVTVAQFGHVFLYLPLYAAQAKGYFREQGLEVTLVSTGGDDKTFAAVAAGSAQYGVADPVFTAIAGERGQGAKVISSVVNGMPFWGVTYRKDLKPITAPAQFAGLRVATYPAPSTNYAAMAETLRQGNVDGQASIVQGSFGSLLAILRAGKADVAMELEPVASLAVQDGGHIVYSSAQRYGAFAFTGISATDAHLAREPEQARAVVRAVAKAIDWLHADFEGATALARAEFPEVPEPVIRVALRRLLDDGVIPASPRMSEQAWARAVDLRRALGEIKGTARYQDYVDMRFVPDAAR